MENLILCAVLTAKILNINVVQAFAEGVTNLKLDKTVILIAIIIFILQIPKDSKLIQWLPSKVLVYRV